MIAHPILCWAHLAIYVSVSLILWTNPSGKVTNSKMDLEISVLHHSFMEDYFDLWERTTLVHI